MGRHKKSIAAVPDSARDDWMRQVGRQGGGIFLRIHARQPGLKGRFPIVAMNQAMSDIDDLEEHCYESWGEDKEFKIFPLDASEQPAKDAAGVELPPLVIRPRRAPIAAAASAPTVSSADPILADEQKRLAAERARLDIDRERIRIDAERRDVDRMKNGGTPTGDHDPMWPLGRGVEFKVVWVGPGPNDYAQVPLDADDLPRGGVRFGRDREPKKDQMELFMMMMIEQGKESRAAADRQMQLMMGLLTREDPIIKILPLIVGGQMKLPELMAMMDTMTKGQQAAMKSALENNGEIMKMVAEHALESGAPDDMISNIKRIGDAATEITGKLVKQTTGRESLLNPDKPKALPPAPEATGPQPVQARKPTKPGPAIDAGQPLPPPPPQGALAAPATPAEQAKAVGFARCTAFMDLHEREMLNGSGVGVFFDDEKDAMATVQAVVGLPSPIRAAIDDGEAGAIYEAFKVHIPDQVARIFAAMEDPKEGPARKKFAEEFWAELAEELDTTRPERPEDEEPEPEHPQRVAE